MNYIKIENCNLVNGDGARVVLWVSGCSHKCPGCHNPESWDHNFGTKFDAAATDQILNLLANPFISGITISGGDPLNPLNYATVLELCQILKQKFPNKTIWIWTGFTIEELKKLQLDAIFKFIDCLIDGRYMQTLPTKKKFRGSDNQKRYQFINGVPELID